jgi:hypothetical protein
MPSPSPAQDSGSAAESLAGQLRTLGSRAHQVHAATRAADHYLALDTGNERDTGNWLLASAVSLAQELALDLDGLARTLKDRQADAALQTRMASLRARAHQLHAAAKAADRFLEQDNRDDHDTGGWLVPLAQTLAAKLAAEVDDMLTAARRPAPGKAERTSPEAHDPELARRISAATAAARA